MVMSEMDPGFFAPSELEIFATNDSRVPAIVTKASMANVRIFKFQPL